MEKHETRELLLEVGVPEEGITEETIALAQAIATAVERRVTRNAVERLVDNELGMPAPAGKSLH